MTKMAQMPKPNSHTSSITPELRLNEPAISRLIEVVYSFPDRHGAAESIPPPLDSSHSRTSKEGSPLYLGEVHARFDEKGRVTIPAAFRPLFQSPDGAVLTRSPDGCLWAFTAQEHGRIVNEILAASAVSLATRALHRYLTAYAYNAPKLDPQNRIRLPIDIRQLVFGVDSPRDLVLCGSGNLIEFWPVELWAKHLENLSGGGAAPDRSARKAPAAPPSRVYQVESGETGSSPDPELAQESLPGRSPSQ